MYQYRIQYGMQEFAEIIMDHVLVPVKVQYSCTTTVPRTVLNYMYMYRYCL